MKDTAEMKTYIEKLKESFCFHDSFVFSAKLKGNDYVVYIETYEDHDWEKCACVKITFKNVTSIKRDDDRSIRTKLDEEGYLESNCRYNFEHIRQKNDVLIIQLVVYSYMIGSYRKIVIECEDVEFVKDIPLKEVPDNREI